MIIISKINLYTAIQYSNWHAAFEIDDSNFLPVEYFVILLSAYFDIYWRNSYRLAVGAIRRKLKYDMNKREYSWNRNARFLPLRVIMPPKHKHSTTKNHKG